MYKANTSHCEITVVLLVCISPLLAKVLRCFLFMFPGQNDSAYLPRIKPRVSYIPNALLLSHIPGAPMFFISSLSTCGSASLLSVSEVGHLPSLLTHSLTVVLPAALVQGSCPGH